MPYQRNARSRPETHLARLLLALTVLVIAGLACDSGPMTDDPIPSGSLEIEVIVTGSGSVEVPEYGFSCRDTCLLTVETDAPVTLTALPDGGQVAVAWDGPCDALDEACSWSAAQDARVGITFAPHALRLALTGNGRGRFDISDGTSTTSCREACGVGLDEARSVAITYFSEGTRTEVGPWTGACAGEAPNYCLVDVAGRVDVSTTWVLPPFVQDKAYTTDQETVLRVAAQDGLLADVGADRGQLRVTLAAQPEHGEVVLEDDGAFTYEPRTGFSGVGTFDFQVEDDVGPVDDATVRITVRPRLALSKAGAGDGRVSSDPPGIDCGTNCTSDVTHFDPGTTVTLSATPDGDSTFSGWDGACSGTSTCVITIDDPAAVSATFAPLPAEPTPHTLTLTITGDGSGSVTSDPDGIDASSGTTTAEFDQGTTVTLSATATGDSTFSGWDGACSGTSTTCTVVMTEDRTVSATFAPPLTDPVTLTVTITGNGSGSVTSDPDGIDVDSEGRTGSAQFERGTPVYLGAEEADGSSFDGWGGACRGEPGRRPHCNLTLTENTDVTAGFSLR